MLFRSYHESSFISCSGMIMKYSPVIGSICTDSKISPEFFFIFLYINLLFSNYIVFLSFMWRWFWSPMRVLESYKGLRVFLWGAEFFCLERYIEVDLGRL